MPQNSKPYRCAETLANMATRVPATAIGSAPAGVLVEQLIAESPANGKLEVYDVITAINGKPVRNVTELRTVIVLRHFMHLSYQDMGDILQLPEKTVKSRLHDARQVLREALQRRGVVCHG